MALRRTCHVVTVDILTCWLLLYTQPSGNDPPEAYDAYFTALAVQRAQAFAAEQAEKLSAKDAAEVSCCGELNNRVSAVHGRISSKNPKSLEGFATVTPVTHSHSQLGTVTAFAPLHHGDRVALWFIGHWHTGGTSGYKPLSD